MEEEKKKEGRREGGRKGGELGGDQRRSDLPKAIQQVRGKARTRVLSPQNGAASLSLHGDYQSRNPNPAFPATIEPHATTQEARGKVCDKTCFDQQTQRVIMIISVTKVINISTVAYHVGSPLCVIHEMLTITP